MQRRARRRVEMHSKRRATSAAQKAPRHAGPLGRPPALQRTGQAPFCTDLPACSPTALRWRRPAAAKPCKQPISMHHLGIWFNLQESPACTQTLGCSEKSTKRMQAPYPSRRVLSVCSKPFFSASGSSSERRLWVDATRLQLSSSSSATKLTLLLSLALKRRRGGIKLCTLEWSVGSFKS